ncbi:MAG TPA: hypothetical protein PKC18_03355, partial [Lacipirellulaceae bacterium]|nr:hypothetical protein [Lacipirellulaceae bacterium]
MAGLVVRNPAMVGQIVGCPKCGSMVHVVPPAAAGVSGATVAVEAGQRPAAVDAPLSVPAFDDVDQLDAPVASSQAVEGPVATTAVPQTPPAAPAVAAPWSGAKLATMAVGSFVLGSALVAGVLTALRSSESPADFGAAPEASEPAVVAAPKADLLPPAPDESARLESAEPAPAAVAASAEPSKPAPLIRTDVPPADAANDMGDDIPPPAPQP